MAVQSCLILIKPDGLIKSLTGFILTELSETKLKIIGAKVVSVSKELAEVHYEELKQNKPHIFENVLKYIQGEYHTPRVLALVYHGEDAIQKIKAPTLIFWGSDDRIISVKNATSFEQLIPGSKKIVFDGVGHMPMLEIAEKSAKQYQEFLAGMQP